jgi:hypothetical protein
MPKAWAVVNVGWIPYTKGIKLSIHLAEIYNAAETAAFIRFEPERIGHGTYIHPATGTFAAPGRLFPQFLDLYIWHILGYY